MQDRQEGPVPAEQQALANQAVAVLAPHEQLVVAEHQELSEKLTKLDAFIAGDFYRNAAGSLLTDKTLLERQRLAMAEYQFVLAARINRFGVRFGADSEGGEV